MIYDRYTKFKSASDFCKEFDSVFLELCGACLNLLKARSHYAKYPSEINKKMMISHENICADKCRDFVLLYQGEVL